MKLKFYNVHTSSKKHAYPNMLSSCWRPLYLMFNEHWPHVWLGGEKITILTWSPAFGPSEWKRIGRHLLSSFIKLEFWKWAIRAAFPWMRAYASDATFSLLNFSHFLPLNACRKFHLLFYLVWFGQGWGRNYKQCNPGVIFEHLKGNEHKSCINQ